MTGIGFLIILAALAALGVFVAGGVSMARGGKYDRQHVMPLMEAEVIVQAILVGMVIIAALFWV